MVAHSNPIRTPLRRSEKTQFRKLKACCCLIGLFATTTPLSGAETNSVPDGWQSTGNETTFEVTDSDVLNPVTSGRWRLSGTLKVQFVGRIKPHENSQLRLFGPGLAALEGRFDRVVLPAGWRYELKYDESAKTVTLSNLRPDHAPAFPGAEGFGKYTTGGHLRKKEVPRFTQVANAVPPLVAEIIGVALSDLLKEVSNYRQDPHLETILRTSPQIL